MSIRIGRFAPFLKKIFGPGLIADDIIETLPAVWKQTHNLMDAL